MAAPGTNNRPRNRDCALAHYGKVLEQSKLLNLFGNLDIEERKVSVKRLVPFVTMIVIMAIAAATTQSQAQQGMRWRGSGGWGPGTKYGGLYDPKGLETVSGQVVKIDKITPIRGMSYGVHLILKTDQGDISVHLGPGWYIENQDMKIE